MKKVKILIVGNGGTGVAHDGSLMINSNTADFLLELHNSGIDVNFCQFQVTYDKDSDLQNFDLANSEIKTTLIENYTNIGVFKNIIYIFRILRYYDFVYLFFPGKLSFMFGLICVLIKKKYGIYLRGELLSHKRALGFIIKRALFILTVSPHFIPIYKTPKNRIKVIRPMITFDVNDISKRVFSSKKSFRLLFVGRVEERKGIYDLISIVEYLSKTDIDFHLDVVGGGSLLYKLRTEQFQNRNNHCINFVGQIGNVDTLRMYYKKADALILTTHDEGFPRVLYEAMIFGVPIYTTMVGGIPGRMKNYYNCIEIPLQDAKKASDLIYSTINNTNLLSQITTNANRTIFDILKNEASHSLLLKNELYENFK